MGNDCQQASCIQYRQGNEKKHGRHVSLPSIQVKPKQRGRKVSPAIANAESDKRPEEESIEAKAKRLLQLPRREDGSCGSVYVKFNHYIESFPIHNGVLKWSDIDDAYCFSFVYRGMYRREIICINGLPAQDGKKYMRRDDNGEYFIDLDSNYKYEVEIEEDPIVGVGVEGLRVNDEPLLKN